MNFKGIITFVFGLTAIVLAGCGGSSSGPPPATTPTAAVNNGIIVTPNLGPTTGSTITLTDLTTNQVLGTTNTQNANGTYQLPANPSTNPVIITVTGGTYLDEATGTQQPVPAAGISACLPDPGIAQAAITPITEVATQAAIKAAAAPGANVTPAGLAAIVDTANKNVGSALLGGADPTTTIPVDISQPIPGGATQEQQNYARVLAGLAVDAAANSGGDLAVAATALTNGLFDANGAPATGPAPAAVTRLQAATTNYTPPAGILAANVPAADPTVVVGPVNTALVAVNGNQFDFMEVIMDFNSIAGTPSQTPYTEVVFGLNTPSVANNNAVWSETFVAVNGVPGVVVGQGTNPIAFTSNNEMQFFNRVGSPFTYSFSRDGEFAVGENIQGNGSESVRLSFLVKHPVTAPTVASVAGIYRIVLMGRDHSLPGTALPGYTENGTLTLDGAGGSIFAGTNTTPDVGFGPVFTPVNGASTYTIDAATGAVVLNAAGNGHIFLSANGQYGLYELHGGGTQEWGIVIKEHAATIPFTAMQNGLMYDVHNHGGTLLKALDFRTIAPHANGLATDILSTSVKAFSPVDLAPNLWCGATALPALPAFPAAIPAIPATPAVVATAACVMRDIPIRFYPVAPNTATSAANGEFTAMDSAFFGMIPNFVGYVSQNGDVSWVDDGEAGSIAIFLGR